jgi:hypothetical protein
VSLLVVHFLGFGFRQILSLNMDYFLWRRPGLEALQTKSTLNLLGRLLLRLPNL